MPTPLESLPHHVRQGILLRHLAERNKATANARVVEFARLMATRQHPGAVGDVCRLMNISRHTAARYQEKLAAAGRCRHCGQLVRDQEMP